MTWEAWFTLAVAVATVVLLATDRFDPVMVVGGAVLALFMAGIIDQDQALAGFSNEAPATVAALFVLSGAAQATGALDGAVARILGCAHPDRLRQDLAVVCVPSAGISAFIANTPLVSMLAPTVVRWCQRTGRSPSLYLMPLSYAVIFGGCVTLVGTSTNLFVNDLLDQAGLKRLGLFDITGVGLPLAVIGVGLIVVLGPCLLRRRQTPTEDLGDQAREFTVEMLVTATSPSPPALPPMLAHHAR